MDEWGNPIDEPDKEGTTSDDPWANSSTAPATTSNQASDDWGNSGGGSGGWGDSKSTQASNNDGWGSSSSNTRSGGGDRGCFNCGGSGHMSRECPNPKKERGGGDRGCYNCGESGHMSRECPNPKKERGGGGGGGGDRACFNCGESGHMSRECPNPRKERGGGGGGGGGGRSCFNCGESGHMSRECTNPKKEGARPPRPSNTDAGGWNTNDDGGWGGTSSTPAETKPSDSGGDWGTDTGNSDWGVTCQSSGSPAKRPPRSSNTSEWNTGSSDNNNAADKPNASRDQEERPAPYRPEELDLEEEVKLQADIVGENFKKYQEQTVTCLPPNLIKPIEKFENAIQSKLLLENLTRLKYSDMTPIQKWAIPAIADGHDLIGCAQTGSGKTAAFLLPILQYIMKQDLGQNDPNSDCQNPYCLIIAPTRELTKQIYTNAEMLSRDSIVKSCFLYGQISTAHLKAQLSKGCHVLVSTLGRLKDFTERGWIGYSNIKYIVLDEGDRLIEDGFSEELKGILNHPTMPSREERQLLFFSATFKKDQQKNAKEYLRQSYVFITVGRIGAANEDIKQEFVEVTRPEKKTKLKEILLQVPETDKAIIFTQTKVSADMLAAYFTTLSLSSTSIHGDRHQSQREQAISAFRRGEKRFLISSPVGNRGLDLPKVALVINYDLPENIDEYVHRIGRTGRAGHTGRAISLFERSRDMEILPDLIKILKEVKQEIPEWMTESEFPQPSSSDDWAAGATSSANVPDDSVDDWGGSASTGAAGFSAEEDWGATDNNATSTSNQPTNGELQNSGSNRDDWGGTPSRPSNGANRSFNNRTPSGNNSNRSTRYSYREEPQNGSESDAPTTSAVDNDDSGSVKRSADDDGGNPSKKLDQGEQVDNGPVLDFGGQEW